MGGRVGCPPQSNSQDEAHRADCLAAKEVLRPVVLPHPSLHPPSGAPQMPRYSKCSCAHKPLPVDGTGGRRSDKHGPTLVSKLSCRSAPLHRSLYSLFFFLISLSLSVLHTPLPQTGSRKKCGRAQGGGKEAQCERIVLTVGEPEQNGECPSL